MFIAESFLLGLVQGLFCAGSCLPVVSFFIMSKERTFKAAAGILGLFLSGRLLGYLSAGVLCSLAGKAGLLYGCRTCFYGASYGLIGALMIVSGIAHMSPGVRLCGVLRRASERSSWIAGAGVVSGLAPCPPFVGMILLNMERADVFSGTVSFSAFFLATSLYLLPSLAASRLSRITDFRKASFPASVLAGAYFLLKSFGLYKGSF